MGASSSGMSQPANTSMMTGYGGQDGRMGMTTHEWRDPAMTSHVLPVGNNAMPVRNAAMPSAGGKGGVGGQMPQTGTPVSSGLGQLMMQGQNGFGQYAQQNPYQGQNVFNQASTGLTNAMAGTQNEMAYRPISVQAGQGQAAITGAQGYTPATTDFARYNAAQASMTPSVQAQNVQAGQIAGSDLTQYTNPYESQVVQQSLNDLERSRQMQANQIGAQATAAGAYGGSRQAIMESELNRNAMEQAAKLSSGLRQSGFQNAQQLAGQDIATRMQSGLANQGANLQAGSLNANLGQQINLANQAALNQAGQFGAGAANTAMLQNQAALNQAGQFGAGAANTAALQNQAALNNMTQFNLGNQLQAALANQGAGLAGSQQRLGAAGQLGNLANLGFGMGQQAQQMQMGAGNAAYGINQALIDAAKGQYGGYTGAPAASLGYMGAALGATPNVGSTTQNYSPGLFDYLRLGTSFIPK